MSFLQSIFSVEIPCWSYIQTVASVAAALNSATSFCSFLPKILAKSNQKHRDVFITRVLELISNFETMSNVCNKVLEKYGEKKVPDMNSKVMKEVSDLKAIEERTSVKLAKAKGMVAIEHIAWYVLSILNINEGRFDIAYGVLNNSNIQMEKNGVISEYLTMLNKVNMYKVLMCTKSQDQAQICMNQASYIVQKYGINFNLNIDIKKILLENSGNDRVDNQTLNKTSSVVQSESTEKNSGFDEYDGEVVNPNEFFS